jgi:hypothetical protein
MLFAWLIMLLGVFIRSVFVLLIILLLGGFPADSAMAVLRQHQDAPGVMHYHSQVSLKDDLGYSWQVLLYKIFKPGQPQDVHLRLVGFPGVFEFIHPNSLEILTARGRLLNASDVYAQESPAANVGEYNLTDVLPQLHNIDSLELYLPLQGEKPLVLELSKAVVTEWQWLITEVN